MQIPKPLPEFSSLTLLVAADHITARCWLLGGRECQELEGVSMPRERKTDNETSFVNVDTRGVNGPEPSDQNRLEHFSKTIAAHLVRLTSTHKIARLLCAWPKDMAALIRTRLPRDLQSKIQKELAGIFTQDNPIEFIKRFF